jgi:EpsI family protein
LHAFIVGLALATLAGVLHHERWKPRVALLLLAMGLSLLANWLRVFAVVVAGHLTAMQHFLIVTDHYYFGWALFSLFMVPLFVVDWQLQRPSDASLASQSARSARWSLPGPLSLAIALLVVAGACLLQLRVFTTDFADAGLQLAAPEVPAWRMDREWTAPTLPSYEGVDAFFAAWYVQGPVTVGAYVGHYVAQRQGHEVIYFGNRPEGSAAVIDRRTAVSAEERGARGSFTELLLEDPSRTRRLAWVGLRVGGADVSSGLGAKLRQVAGVLTGRRYAQVLVLTAECATTCEAARANLADYAAAATNLLYEAVPP